MARVFDQSSDRALTFAYAAAALGVLYALVPLNVVGDAQQTSRPGRRRLVQLEAVLLTLYGLVLTSVGLLVQADVIHRSTHADQRALAWHAFFWDPVLPTRTEMRTR